MNVTFIGLGIMGSRMARNLLNKDVSLTVMSRSPEAVEALAQAGARAAGSFTEAVAEADLVFSMLSTPEVVEQIFLAEQGCLTSMKAGAKRGGLGREDFAAIHRFLAE